MPRTLGALLAQRAGAIVGRDHERAQLRRLLEPAGPVVAYVHGLAGVGKTTLLQAFAADARAAGFATVDVDGHVDYPTHGSLLSALKQGVRPHEPPALADAVAALSEPTVLLIDTFELLRPLDHWICRTLIPALPAHVRVVIAGRDDPAGRWRSYGPLLCTVPLANLSPEESLDLLADSGVDADTAPRINAIAHGHPLSLQLAAGALRDRPGLALEEIAVGAVGEELARVYLDGLDAPTRRALDAASLLRRTTLTLLAAMLGGGDAADAFERLRRLPFVALGADGLLVHDTVREATAALLRAADPQEYWRLRAAAWARVRTELKGAPPRELSRYTADLIYLLDDAGVRRAFFPAAVGEQRVAPATADDLPAIERLARGDAALVRAWWESVPSAFFVTRDRHDAVIGFGCLAEPADVGPRLIDRDPRASAWRAHLRGDPPPKGQRTLFLRWMVGRDYPAVAALVLDVTRTYMEMRPELRRVYGREEDLIGADGSCAMAMGYLPLAGVAHTVCMDFGPASVDGWLADLGARERLEESDEVPDGLTRLEAQVLSYLRAREGQAVDRAALLRDVWGYEWTGGSNVVEVVISSLRRKLADDAGAIATVRGVGYRYGRASSTMLNSVSVARRT
ncbi:MAG TPA: winged helix-turn-helix domain-containing protein [Solirubrobacteraceae bacterium]|nr:winged helix-turn-helix domain-containing protein [Solirubrobacteraceae bacterium]